MIHHFTNSEVSKQITKQFIHGLHTELGSFQKLFLAIGLKGHLNEKGIAIQCGATLVTKILGAVLSPGTQVKLTCAP